MSFWASPTLVARKLLGHCGTPLFQRHCFQQVHLTESILLLVDDPRLGRPRLHQVHPAGRHRFAWRHFASPRTVPLVSTSCREQSGHFLVLQASGTLRAVSLAEASLAARAPLVVHSCALQDDGCASNQRKHHHLRVIREHQSVEQKVALEKARNCLSARSQTCRRACERLRTRAWQLRAKPSNA